MCRYFFLSFPSIIRCNNPTNARNDYDVIKSYRLLTWKRVLMRKYTQKVTFCFPSDLWQVSNWGWFRTEQDMICDVTSSKGWLWALQKVPFPLISITFNIDSNSVSIVNWSQCYQHFFQKIFRRIEKVEASLTFWKLFSLPIRTNFFHSGVKFKRKKIVDNIDPWSGRKPFLHSK